MKLFTVFTFIILSFMPYSLNASEDNAPVIRIESDHYAYQEGDTITLTFIIDAIDDLQGFQVDIKESPYIEFSNQETPYSYNSTAHDDHVLNRYDDGMGSLLVIKDQPVHYEADTTIFSVSLTAKNDINNIEPLFLISDDVDHIRYGDTMMSLKFSDHHGEKISYHSKWDFIHEPPSFELIGNKEKTLEIYETYEELGATYGESYSLIIEGNVDTDNIGQYRLEYFLEDNDNNRIYMASRTIEVIDTTPPEIILNQGIDTIYKNDTWEDAAVSVSDNYDENPNVEVQGQVDPTTTGSYIITYTATDISGNSSTIERYVHVIESPLEVSFDLPKTTTTLAVGMEYDDPGCFIEIMGETFMCNIEESTIDKESPGTYTITYSYTYQGETYYAMRKVFYVEIEDNANQLLFYLPSKRWEDML